MNAINHNARSVVAAWRANPDTTFTGLYQQARPSTINYRAAITYTLLADELTSLRDGLLDDGFPATYPLIAHLNDLLATTVTRADSSHAWAKALREAEDAE